jgi:recombination protein RecR
MTQVLPRALDDLIADIGVLPGVGARTAERYSLYLLKSNAHLSQKLARTLDGLHERVKLCPVTFAFIDAGEAVSPLYSSPDRDKTLVAVVEDPFDVLAIENTGQFTGTSHVLGGAISPIDGITPEQLHLPELIARIKNDGVSEIILATNPSVEGESTALYIQRQLENVGLDSPIKSANDKGERGNDSIKITRLARGLPSGVDLAYADQITIAHALKGRQDLS